METWIIRLKKITEHNRGRINENREHNGEHNREHNRNTLVEVAFLQEQSQCYLILKFFTIQDLGNEEKSSLLAIKYVKTFWN